MNEPFFTRSIGACMVALGRVLRSLSLWVYALTMLTLLIAIMPIILARLAFLLIKSR